MRIEPKWFKLIKERITINGEVGHDLIDNILIRRQDLALKVFLRKDLLKSSQKESNKEIITWSKKDDTIFSI